MEIDIFDIEKFIKVNNLQEVTNPIIIEKDNVPTRDGLLSTDIFGRTVDDRKSIWAYISLNGKFFHPYLYKILKRIDRRFESIVAGSLYVTINESGEIIEDQENGETGITFLAKNFDKIKFKKNTSIMRNERIDLCESLKQDEIFVQHFLICPPFYRDIQSNKLDKGKISYGD